jgi:transposase-like protein
VKSSIRPRPWLPRKSAFAGFRFPADVIVFAVRCYLRFNLSYRNVEELLVERYANNPIEADHSQLKHRLRPMRGLQTDQTAQVIIAGHAFMQNVRGHYELAVDATSARRVAAAFTELAQAI